MSLLMNSQRCSIVNLEKQGWKKEIGFFLGKPFHAIHVLSGQRKTAAGGELDLNECTLWGTEQ